jgi:hypothetical protein
VIVKESEQEESFLPLKDGGLFCSGEGAANGVYSLKSGVANRLYL